MLTSVFYFKTSWRAGINMSDTPKEVEKYGDALIKAWEQYLKIIDILIALSGATALIMVNVMKEFGKEVLHSPLAMTTFCFFALTLLFLALWRFAAQHFYEYETIGSAKIAKQYFEFHGIDKPVTKAFEPHTRLREFYRGIYKIVSQGSGLCLALTWVLFVALVAR
jgi:signal transduction histidine kinase